MVDVAMVEGTMVVGMVDVAMVEAAMQQRKLLMERECRVKLAHMFLIRGSAGA